jgi:hypothetical protein
MGWEIEALDPDTIYNEYHAGEISKNRSEVEFLLILEVNGGTMIKIF